MLTLKVDDQEQTFVFGNIQKQMLLQILKGEKEK
ncbi:Uncharacterised protein [Rodentibacter pneumotropicus]|uniref:Uncharacterized protein n=1 Tax=Rodentibacter pneumotropicus TaxID=758 RepID=A0A3S4XU03_9PAST|nr:Uncharacterised protein [Rodentibacter pneumotropicus]